MSICQLHIPLNRTAQIYLELHFCVELHTKKSPGEPCVEWSASRRPRLAFWRARGDALRAVSLLCALSRGGGQKKKVKEADLYSAFIEVPYTQGAQVWITQCYLQITPYLPLPRKHSPDGASHTEVADIYCSLLLIYLPRKDERLSWPGWLVT